MGAIVQQLVSTFRRFFFTCNISCNPHNNPMRQVNHYSHFTDEKTESQRNYVYCTQDSNTIRLTFGSCHPGWQFPPCFLANLRNLHYLFLRMCEQKHKETCVTWISFHFSYSALSSNDSGENIQNIQKMLERTFMVSSKQRIARIDGLPETGAYSQQGEKTEMRTEIKNKYKDIQDVNGKMEALQSRTDTGKIMSML